MSGHEWTTSSSLHDTRTVNLECEGHTGKLTAIGRVKSINRNYADEFWFSRNVWFSVPISKCPFCLPCGCPWNHGTMREHWPAFALCSSPLLQQTQLFQLLFENRVTRAFEFQLKSTCCSTGWLSRSQHAANILLYRVTRENVFRN